MVMKEIKLRDRINQELSLTWNRPAYQHGHIFGARCKNFMF